MARRSRYSETMDILPKNVILMLQMGKSVDLQKWEDRRNEQVGGMKKLKRQSKKRKLNRQIT